MYLNTYKLFSRTLQVCSRHFIPSRRDSIEQLICFDTEINVPFADRLRLKALVVSASTRVLVRPIVVMKLHVVQQATSGTSCITPERYHESDSIVVRVVLIQAVRCFSDTR